MRLAGHTYSFRDRPLAEALDELAALDLEFVEVWIGHARMTPDDVACALTERRLRAVAVSAGGFYSRDATAPAHAFKVAVATGAPVVVACISPPLLPTIARSAPAGVALCVENHWDQPLATAIEVKRAIEHRPSIRACLDTGHALLAGVPPERFARSLGARLGHVHLKDARRQMLSERLLGRRLRRRFLGQPEPVFPGDGGLSFEALRIALSDARYDGAVSLEYEGQDPTAALGELMRRWGSREDDRAEAPRDR